jgi:glycosyltransferase involved in cell wall biosynthesis
MRISIALCTFNGMPYIGEQLASIANQTRPADELVISDDGSTDGTLEAVEQARARIVRNPRRLGTTRNFAEAIATCTGDVIFLADQDDIWDPRKIEVMTGALESADCVFTNARLERGLLWDYIGFTRGERRRVRRGHAFDVLLRHNVATGATMAFRSQWREAILPIPDGIPHDRWIALILSAVGRVDCLDAPLIDYRQHAGQQTGIGGRVSAARRIELARTTGSAEWKRRADELRLALPRLEQLGAARRAFQLRDYVDHLDTRATLPGSFSARASLVIRELPRYFRHSRHVLSMAKDLLASGRT